MVTDLSVNEARRGIGLLIQTNAFTAVHLVK